MRPPFAGPLDGAEGQVLFFTPAIEPLSLAVEVTQKDHLYRLHGKPPHGFALQIYRSVPSARRREAWPIDLIPAVFNPCTGINKCTRIVQYRLLPRALWAPALTRSGAPKSSECSFLSSRLKGRLPKSGQRSRPNVGCGHRADGRNDPFGWLLPQGLGSSEDGREASEGARHSRGSRSRLSPVLSLRLE
jgi:hypothetical protein